MVGFVSMLAQRSPLLFRSGGFGKGSGVAVTSNAIANVFNRSQQPFPSHGVGVVVGNNVKNQQQLRGMASKKHKAILRLSKGYRGRANRCYRTAIARVEKAWQYAYRDRKQKKRDFRRLWIQRVNAGVRQHGLSYSGFIRDLNTSEVDLDRKILANLAGQEPFSFKAVVDVVKMRTAK